MENDPPPPTGNVHRTWPWLLAGLLLLGVVIAVVGVRAEVRRIHEQRNLDMPASGGVVR